jgi:hypothetical protein
MRMRTIATTALLVGLLLPTIAFAQLPRIPGLPSGGGGQGQAISGQDVIDFVASVIEDLLIVAALVVVGFIVYAGLKMATAGEDSGAFGKAKETLINAIIGAVVIFGVGIIVRTIANFATNPTGVF